MGESWNTPEYTSDVTGLGVLRMLEAIRECDKNIKFYQASSSEMFGRMVENPATEKNSLLSQKPVWCRKALWPLDNKKTIENLTTCLHVPEFFLIMSLSVEE